MTYITNKQNLNIEIKIILMEHLKILNRKIRILNATTQKGHIHSA